jgi:(2Fe-2S) ferredoxin
MNQHLTPLAIVMTDSDHDENADSIEGNGVADSKTPGYDLHVFICGHERSENATRPSCALRGSLAVVKKLKQAVRDAGIKSVRVQKSGCLNYCEHGISCVLYPESVWYSIKNPEADINSILNHLKTGIIDTDLLMKID